jgi:subtilase family serine protease
VQQFTERFGPSQADYDAVVAFAKANGMTVTATPANRMLVDVEAAVGDVNRAFHVSMGVYQHPTENRTFYAPDREPTVDLNVPLWHIAGLDNYSPPRSALRYATPGEAHTAIDGSGQGGTYLGSDIRAAYYGGTTLTGAGQTIGLYGLNYNLSDVELYFSTIGQPFNPSQVTNYSTDGTVSTCPNNCDDGEPAIDIQQALSMAPGANIVEYFGSSDADVYEAAATANIAKQMSASYLWGPADPTTDEPIFEEMAAQGQSLFAATGDSGAYSQPNNEGMYPADDPYMTGVGGTDLTTNGAGGAWESETAWIGSSGGIDDQPTPFAIPSYQQLSGVINASNQGSTTLRNIPDVSSDANTDSFWCSSGSCYEGVGGTSLAAPRWAGFMALINQQAANNNEPPVGFLNPTIYSIGLGSSYGTDFHDITSGNNFTTASPNLFTAVTGYDLVTGWGSPNGQGLIDALTPASSAPYYALSASPTTVTIPATGGDGTSTIQLASGNGFTGTVTLSAVVVGPASGVTVSFNPTTVTGSGTSTMTISTTDSISGNLQVVVSGTSPTVGVLTQPAYVTISTPGYTVASSPTTVYLNQSAAATSTITVTPQNNFNAAVALSTSDLPTGVSGAFNPASTASTSAASTSTMTLTASASAQTTLGTQFYVTGTSGSITQSAGPTIVVSAATGTGGSGTPVSLVSAYNVNGIYTDGTSFTTGGLDGDGNAYSSTLLTANRIYNGTQFNFGPANAPDAVKGTGQTITLPAGQFTTLQLLGTGINGSQAAQPIIVTYTDGSTSTFTQGFGDWASGLGGFTNESEAVGMAYFNVNASNGGGKGSGQRNLYAYYLALNSAKTVASLTLPNNSNVVVLAATLTTQSLGTQLSFAGEYNMAALFTNGTTFSATLGMDGGGDSCTLSGGCADAFSSQQSGLTLATPPSLTFNSLLFNFGTVNTVDCTTACILDAIDLNPGTTITLPSNQQTEYSTMTLLGTGVQGGGSATVTINYTTGSPTVFTQIFSDWCNYASNANETIAVGAMSRINSDGTLSTVAACNLYAYTYPVDATRIVKSVTLTNATSNFQTIAFALTLTSSSASSTAGFTLSDSPSTLSVDQGSSGTSTITVNPTGGFTGDVTLAASGLPSGVTAAFATNPTTGSSVLTLTASSTATTGTATVTITGTSGSLTTTTTVVLTVNAPPAGGFTIGASPATLTVARGSSGTSTITITSTNGFNSAVTFSATGMPSGVTATFSPTSVTPAANGSVTSTLTLAVSSSATAALSHNGRPLFPTAALAAVLCCIGWKRRRRLQMLLLLVVSGIGLSLLNGCGGSTPSIQSSTITVTATSGSLQQSTIITLSVN